MNMILPIEETGARFAPAHQSREAELPLDQILEGDCIAEMARLPDKSVDMIFADPPYNLAAWRRPVSARRRQGRCRRRRLGQVRQPAVYDDFTREWLAEARRILKDDGTIWVIGSYHNIYRVGRCSGRGILDLERHRLAQVEPDAELPRHPLHQRPRNVDLVREGREGALHLQLSRDESAERRSADALRLGAADLRGGERVKDDAGDKAHPTQKPEALLYRILLACTKPGDVVLDSNTRNRTSR